MLNLRLFSRHLLVLLAVLSLIPSAIHAQAQNVKVLQFSGFIVGIEGPVTGVRARINVHASGSTDTLVGKGQDYPTHSGGNVNFYDLLGSIDGNLITLSGVISKSTADLEGLPVEIEANTDTNVITFTIPLSIFGLPFDLVFEGIADTLVLKLK